MIMHAFFEHRGIKLSYYVDDFTDPWTDSPTIIMLHGAMANARRFFSWVPGLCKDFRVVRLDMRGHGDSQVPDPDQDLSLSVLVNDVIALMDHLKCKSAHFVGNSAGGYVAQHLAMDHRDRVLWLALFGSAPGLKNSQAASWIPMVQSKGLRQFLFDTIDDRFPPEWVGSARVEHFLDELGDNDVPYIGRFVGYMATQEWGDEVHRIICPTLVVVPGAGRIGSTDVYKPFRESLPAGEVLVYEGERHSICEYLWKRCVADLRSFYVRHRFLDQD
jgi:pimeloyl-ACP methyl ester carboxylesterase